jgi:hypothetical protein
MRQSEDATLKTAYRLLYNSGFLALVFLGLVMLCLLVIDRAY